MAAEGLGFGRAGVEGRELLSRAWRTAAMAEPAGRVRAVGSGRLAVADSARFAGAATASAQCVRNFSSAAGVEGHGGAGAARETHRPELCLRTRSFGRGGFAWSAMGVAAAAPFFLRPRFFFFRRCVGVGAGVASLAGSVRGAAVLGLADAATSGIIPSGAAGRLSKSPDKPDGASSLGIVTDNAPSAASAGASRPPLRVSAHSSPTTMLAPGLGAAAGSIISTGVERTPSSPSWRPVSVLCAMASLLRTAGRPEAGRVVGGWGWKAPLAPVADPWALACSAPEREEGGPGPASLPDRRRVWVADTVREGVAVVVGTREVERERAEGVESEDESESR